MYYNLSINQISLFLITTFWPLHPLTFFSRDFQNDQKSSKRQKRYQYNWFIDWLIDFNGMSTCYLMSRGKRIVFLYLHFLCCFLSVSFFTRSYRIRTILNQSIWPTHRTLTSTTTSSQSGPGSNNYEQVRCTLFFFKIPIWPIDGSLRDWVELGVMRFMVIDFCWVFISLQGMLTAYTNAAAIKMRKKLVRNAKK